ncbi:MAG TPA: response regulator [Flavisolibacter sp.]|nr:response regulator [Flavisolibacter sp.]
MSSRKGPIIIIEDDQDDQELLSDVCRELEVENELKFFSNAADAMHYLMETTDKPLMILSDVNLPMLNGLEMKKKINENDYLRKKSIPFIYLSTSSKKESVEEAYLLMAQGYFEKPVRIDQLRQITKMIIDYWKVCKHPNAD